METLFIEIINEKSKNIIAGTIYRPLNHRFNEFENDNDLKTILTKLDKWDRPCYTMGDFKLIYWNREDICLQTLFLLFKCSKR